MLTLGGTWFSLQACFSADVLWFSVLVSGEWWSFVTSQASFDATVTVNPLKERSNKAFLQGSPNPHPFPALVLSGPQVSLGIQAGMTTDGFCPGAVRFARESLVSCYYALPLR